jgi:hypothetical protein
MRQMPYASTIDTERHRIVGSRYINYTSLHPILKSESDRRYFRVLQKDLMAHPCSTIHEIAARHGWMPSILKKRMTAIRWPYQREDEKTMRYVPFSAELVPEGLN